MFVDKYTFKNGKATDNNSYKSELIYRVEKQHSVDILIPLTDSITFECSKINGNLYPIRIWVGDKGLDINEDGTIDDTERNWDYCDSQVQLLDYDAVCGQYIEFPFSFLTFKLKDTYGKPISGITLKNQHSQDTTDAFGFANLIIVPYYKETVNILTPKQMPSMLTVADLVLIRDHFLGKAPLASQIKQYSADVDNSATVSVTDLKKILKVILGINTPENDFEKGKYKYIFPYETNPDSFISQIAGPFQVFWSFASVSNSILFNNPYISYDTLNMILLEIGDVSYAGTGFATGPNETRTKLPVVFEQIESGKYAAVYRGEEDKSAGFIFAKTQPVEILTANASIEYVNQSNSETRIVFSESIHPGDVLFTLESPYTPDPKNYQGNFVSEEYTESEVSWTVQITQKTTFIQLNPNPSKGQTTLTINLPNDSKLGISLYSSNGKLVSTPVAENEFSKGTHIIQLTEKLAAGSYIVKIKTDFGQETKKLIITN